MARDIRGTQFVVLCEDTRQYHFIAGFLGAKGANPRKIFRSMAPVASGSGEQYVRNAFPEELKGIRKRHAQAILIVCIDQDLKENDRLRYLNLSCEEKGVTPYCSDDSVIRLVPARNIETWFYFLQEEQLPDEERDYKPSVGEAKPGRLGKILADQCSNLIPPPSMATACKEWKRLFS